MIPIPSFECTLTKFVLAKPIGLVKGHLVYHRNDVSILRSREQWLRLCGKVVPENAIPVRTSKFPIFYLTEVQL